MTGFVQAQKEFLEVERWVKPRLLRIEHAAAYNACGETFLYRRKQERPR